MLHTMHDSELIRCYTFDRAGIMFVTDLIKDMLTSLTLRRNAIAPEMDLITTLTTLTYLGTGQCNYQPAMIGSVTALYRTLLCRCSFPIKYVKVDSLVNKK